MGWILITDHFQFCSDMQIIYVSAAFVFRYQSIRIIQNNILKLFQLDAVSLRSKIFISFL